MTRERATLIKTGGSAPSADHKGHTSASNTDPEEEEDHNTSENLDDDDEDEEDSQSSDEEYPEDDYDDIEDEMYGQYYDDDEDEDMEPHEYEVETRESTFGDFKVAFKIYLQEEDDGELRRWLKTIHRSCSYKGKEVGGGLGRYVERDHIRQSFWCDMEEPSQELSTVAFELFDRYGRLKNEFREHAIRKGTGAWGNELDLGSIFIIENIRVDRNWRRKGLGRMIVSYLVEKSRARNRRPCFTLVAPGWLNDDIAPDIQGKQRWKSERSASVPGKLLFPYIALLASAA